MRTLLISLFVFIAVSVGAQGLELNSIKKVEFDDFKTLENKDIFRVSPCFKIDKTLQASLRFTGKDQKKSIEKYLNFNQPELITAIDGMPVASPKGDCWNMPVAEPNPSVEYYLKEKKIDDWIEPVAMKTK